MAAGGYKAAAVAAALLLAALVVPMSSGQAAPQVRARAQAQRWANSGCEGEEGVRGRPDAAHPLARACACTQAAAAASAGVRDAFGGGVTISFCSS